MQVPLPFCGSQLHRTPLQILPQLPQLLSSVVRSEQVPLQQVGLLPRVQTVPQRPQFMMFERVSTHVPAQQAWPWPQLRPQTPQFMASVCVSLQPPLQQV